MGGKCYRKGGEGRAAWLFREGVLYPEAGNVQYSAGLDLIAVWARGGVLYPEAENVWYSADRDLSSLGGGRHCMGLSQPFKQVHLRTF